MSGENRLLYLNTPPVAGSRGLPGPRGDGLGDALERASRVRRSQRALVRRIKRQILCRRSAPEAEISAPPNQARSWRGPDASFHVRRAARAVAGPGPNGTPRTEAQRAPFCGLAHRRLSFGPVGCALAARIKDNPSVSSHFAVLDGARRSRQENDRPVSVIEIQGYAKHS
jgi:hypothetical protein